MSYCRMSEESDVYMYPNIGGFIECCSCNMESDWNSPKFDNETTALKHLFRHVLKGQMVPHRAIKRLCREIVENIKECR